MAASIAILWHIVCTHLLSGVAVYAASSSKLRHGHSLLADLKLCRDVSSIAVHLHSRFTRKQVADAEPKSVGTDMSAMLSAQSDAAISTGQYC